MNQANSGRECRERTVRRAVFDHGWTQINADSGCQCLQISERRSWFGASLRQSCEARSVQQSNTERSWRLSGIIAEENVEGTDRSDYEFANHSPNTSEYAARFVISHGNYQNGYSRKQEVDPKWNPFGSWFGIVCVFAHSLGMITATFTGPRQTSLFPKAARPAAPCATYCYPTFTWLFECPT